MRSLASLAACCALFVVSLGCRDIPPLPRIAKVPAFELLDQRGDRTTAEALRGKVWIANFIFTSCPDVCPLLTAKLGVVRTKLRAERDGLRYVSLSVDPETDTPEVLARYAKEQGADHEGWYFLTGSLDDVQEVVVRGFKQAMEAEPEEPGKPRNILHGSHFVLVDADLQIRGFYSSDDAGMAVLVRDARRLLAGKADG